MGWKGFTSSFTRSCQSSVVLVIHTVERLASPDPAV